MKAIKIDVTYETAKIDQALNILKQSLRSNQLTESDKKEVVEELDNCIEMLKNLKKNVSAG